MIELVKEQAWLNDTLRAFEWKQDPPEGHLKLEDEEYMEDADEMQALLLGEPSPNGVVVEGALPYSLLIRLILVRPSNFPSNTHSDSRPSQLPEPIHPFQDAAPSDQVATLGSGHHL